MTTNFLPSQPVNWFTLGPSSLDCVHEILAAGANGVRLTFSFGTPQLQAERAESIRALARSAGARCTVIADIPGGKPRLGEFAGEDTYQSRLGEKFSLVEAPSADPMKGELPVPDHPFLTSLETGDRILVGDGATILTVATGSDRGVTVEVVAAGRIEQTRGLIAQSERFDPPCLTHADRESLATTAAERAFDAVAISFVSSPEDVAETRDILRASGRLIPVIAKIEHPPGVAAAAAIAASADAVIIGRGDLALTLDWVELPGAVLSVASDCQQQGIPWVVGTQVAEGLERFSFPTRAEICDLARWLDYGASGALLSYETAFGANPIAAVAATRKISERWYRGRESTVSDKH